MASTGTTTPWSYLSSQSRLLQHPPTPLDHLSQRISTRPSQFRRSRTIHGRLTPPHRLGRLRQISSTPLRPNHISLPLVLHIPISVEPEASGTHRSLLPPAIRRNPTVFLHRRCLLFLLHNQISSYAFLSIVCCANLLLSALTFHHIAQLVISWVHPRGPLHGCFCHLFSFLMLSIMHLILIYHSKPKNYLYPLIIISQFVKHQISSHCYLVSWVLHKSYCYLPLA